MAGAGPVDASLAERLEAFEIAELTPATLAPAAIACPVVGIGPSAPLAAPGASSAGVAGALIFAAGERIACY